MPEQAPDGVALLEPAGLRRGSGPVIALDGLMFGLPPGQVFAFLGPNGAGKTTTMRAIFRRRGPRRGRGAPGPGQRAA